VLYGSKNEKKIGLFEMYKQWGYHIHDLNRSIIVDISDINVKINH
jgi:hypothetical protein